MLIRIIVFFLSLIILIDLPSTLKAVETDPSHIELDNEKIVDSSKQLSQEQINDLFGEDPYLGQTSYLQSPDGFNQKKKSK